MDGLKNHFECFKQSQMLRFVMLNIKRNDTSLELNPGLWLEDCSYHNTKQICTLPMTSS